MLVVVVGSKPLVTEMLARGASKNSIILNRNHDPSVIPILTTQDP